jgi:hypothetical protein
LNANTDVTDAKPFGFSVPSSAEKEVIDILLDLDRRQDDCDETIFFIDEPELHISKVIQRELLVKNQSANRQKLPTLGRNP